MPATIPSITVTLASGQAIGSLLRGKFTEKQLRDNPELAHFKPFTERELANNPAIEAWALHNSGQSNPRTVPAGAEIRVPTASAAAVAALVAGAPAVYSSALDAIDNDRRIWAERHGVTTPSPDSVTHVEFDADVGPIAFKWSAATQVKISTAEGEGEPKLNIDGETIKPSWNVDDLTYTPPGPGGKPVYLLPPASRQIEALKEEFKEGAEWMGWSTGRSVMPLGQRGKSLHDQIFTVSAAISHEEFTGGAHSNMVSFARTFDLKAAADPDSKKPVKVRASQLVSEENIQRFAEDIAKRLNREDYPFEPDVESLKSSVRSYFQLQGDSLIVHVPYYHYAPEVARGMVSTFKFDISKDPVFVNAKHNGIQMPPRSIADISLDDKLDESQLIAAEVPFEELSIDTFQRWIRSMGDYAQTVPEAMKNIVDGLGADEKNGVTAIVETLKGKDGEPGALSRMNPRTKAYAQSIISQLEHGVPSAAATELANLAKSPATTPAQVRAWFAGHFGSLSSLDRLTASEATAVMRDQVYMFESNEAMTEVKSLLSQATSVDAVKDLDLLLNSVTSSDGKLHSAPALERWLKIHQLGRPEHVAELDAKSAYRLSNALLGQYPRIAPSAQGTALEIMLRTANAAGFMEQCTTAASLTKVFLASPAAGELPHKDVETLEALGRAADPSVFGAIG